MRISDWSSHVCSSDLFPVQFKTSRSGSLVQSTLDKWCEHSINESNFQKVGKPLTLNHPELIWIMVRLPREGIDGSRFFICTEAQIQAKIIKRFSAFMKKHSNRRPGQGTSKQSVLDIRDLVEYENNWEALNVRSGKA